MTMLHTMLYTIPIAYFPAASHLPLHEKFPSAVQTAMQQCISATAMGVVQFRNSSQAPFQLHVALAPLTGRLTTLQQLLMPTVQPLLARAKADTTADAHQIAAQDMNAVMAEACKIYDNYLGIHFTSAGETFNICEQIA